MSGGQHTCAVNALSNGQTLWSRFNLRTLKTNFITGMDHKLDDTSAYELIFNRPAPIRRDYGTKCINRINQQRMHCCLSGETMIGAQVGNNRFLCAPVLKTPSNEVCAVDSGTQRQKMHACPVGQYMKGLHADKNLLTCCYDKTRGEMPLSNETVDSGTELEDMHGCFAAGEKARIMTGIHVDNNQLLCADSFAPDVK
jgi:hypothetical protein